VVKPDQLIKRRGKLGLIKVNVNLQGAKDFIQENLGKEISVSFIQIKFSNSIRFFRLDVQQEN
jgi:ATP citrate (pro-S)-lyase